MSAGEVIQRLIAAVKPPSGVSEKPLGDGRLQTGTAT